jgi:ABC-type polysaccharide/polyol phosphate transport system ATPase subunit
MIYVVDIVCEREARGVTTTHRKLVVSRDVRDAMNAYRRWFGYSEAEGPIAKNGVNVSVLRVQLHRADADSTDKARAMTERHETILLRDSEDASLDDRLLELPEPPAELVPQSTDGEGHAMSDWCEAFLSDDAEDQVNRASAANGDFALDTALLEEGPGFGAGLEMYQPATSAPVFAGTDEPQVELVNVSKWRGAIAHMSDFKDRHVRNESLQMLIELTIAVRGTKDLARGMLLGRAVDPLLKGINVTIARGSIVGVVDIGGRSRNALLQILSNCDAPSTGEVRYFGKMASVGQLGASGYPHMTCREVLILGGRAVGIDRKDLNVAIEGVAEFSGLRAQLDIPVRRLPRWIPTDLGISLLCCLDYDILVADEVNKPRSRRVVENWTKYLLDASARGKTVILGSKSIDKLIGCCTHLLLLKDAELLAYGEVGHLRDTHAAFLQEAVSAPISADDVLLDALSGDEDDDEE